MALPQLTTLVTLVALASSSIVKPPSNDGTNFELLILHNNDMHARFEQTSQLSGACTTADREAGKCYGGFPRVAYVVKEARRKAASGEGPPVLYLNAGDTYTGTAWFTIYKWKIAAEFLNALEPDAVSLGSNEFENGSTKISSFLENLNSPILSCNVIINSKEAKQKIQKSVVKNINGVKVGIVGYLKIDSNKLDNTDNMEYIDEIIALNDEVAVLKLQEVKIIVALGHSTLERDIEIATEVEGIDLVIAGHKNMFYSNGSNAETNFDNLLQPIIATQKSGKKVPIIHSYAYGKYFGKIRAVFDSEGELELSQTQTDSLLLDESIPQNDDISAIIAKYNDAETTSLATIIGTTVVVLDGETCRTEECNLGNLVADSVMFYYAIRYQGEHWTDAPIAIINGGALSSIISPLSRPFPVRRSDLQNFLPESDNLVVVTVNGIVLKQLLEHSVSDYRLDNATGQFLQLSGIRVVYDLSNEPGSRVISAVARCWNCQIPEFYDIEKERLYKILMPAALASGRYGYSMLVDSPKENLEYDAIATVTEYLQRRSPVYPEIAERVVLLNVPVPKPVPGSGTTLSSPVCMFIFAMLTIISIGSLGNHEFDSGITGLTPFIMNLTCPVLAANLILSKEPDLKNEKNLMKSVVFNINNTRVGIIGYLTPETKVLAVRNNIEYLDEVAAIRQEVKKLKAEGVNISIALGHSGFKRDKEIAYSVDGIDLVIGGHTNTFLWNGTTPDTEMPDGPYPTYVKQASGKLVPVVQAYAYTKYLGKLLITFDSHGVIVNITGNPILLNNSIPQDPDVLAIVHKYQKSVNEVTEIVAGRSSVYLDGQSCRISECNMGNLITDAIVAKYASEYKGDYWTDAPTAILQGGGIRSSVKKGNNRYDVTVGDLYTVMPFEGYIVKVTINGSSIIQMLEHSIAGYKTNGPSGKFLQMSGLRVVYDISKPPGKKVKNTEILCGECDIPEYSNLNMTKEYNILMNGFLSMGGDGFSIFADLPATVLSYNEFQCTREYLNKTSLVHPALEDRIVIINSLNNNAITIKISLTVTIIYFLSLILI